MLQQIDLKENKRFSFHHTIFVFAFPFLLFDHCVGFKERTEKCCCCVLLLLALLFFFFYNLGSYNYMIYVKCISFHTLDDLKKSCFSTRAQRNVCHQFWNGQSLFKCNEANMDFHFLHFMKWAEKLKRMIKSNIFKQFTNTFGNYIMCFICIVRMSITIMNSIWNHYKQ